MAIRGSILLVDDEEKILKALGRALRAAGHEVIETSSPRDAQRLLAERSFAVLLVDNVMPQLSGLDLIREYVASTPEGERPQILMMTAHATVESAIEALTHGARPRGRPHRGHEARRPRLPPEAVRYRRTAGRRETRDRPPASSYGVPV